MTNHAVAQLDVLSSLKGHDKEKIIVNDDDPKKRAKLAEKVIALIRDGFAVLLGDGTRVRGYDAENNEWLVASQNRKDRKATHRVSARDKPATAVAPGAGG